MVSDGREVTLNLLVVSRVFVVVSVHEEVGQVLEGVDVRYGIGLELGEISNSFGGIGDDGLVNEMPVFLPVVALALNNISKSGTLNEGMVLLAESDRGVVFLQRSKHG